MKDLTLEQEAFAEYLKKYHMGKENAVVSRRLSQFGKGRALRGIVHALRVAGVPICSCGQGYYYAKDSEEIRGTIKFLKSYLDNIEKAYLGLKETQLLMEYGETLKE